MSIIVGIITNNCALVASDGRLHSGAYYNNGIRIKDSVVIQDEFDKTFVLDNNKIIGAVAGTMIFNNKSIGEHLKEIFMAKQNSPSVIEDLCQGMKTKLENISSDEISFVFRKVDLILIDSNSGSVEDMNIYSRKFYPNFDNTSIEIEREEIYPKIKGHAAWQTFGDDSSQKAINVFLGEEIQKMPYIDEKKLRSLLYKAIRLGIKKSEKFKDGNDRTCGGKVFVKSIMKSSKF